MELGYLKGKLIRPRGHDTLAMHVRDIQHSHFDKMAVTVKYFCVKPYLGFSEDKDTLYLSKQELMEGYEALVNASQVRSMDEGKWASLKFIEEYADKKREELK